MTTPTENDFRAQNTFVIFRGERKSVAEVREIPAGFGALEQALSNSEQARLCLEDARIVRGSHPDTPDYRVGFVLDALSTWGSMYGTLFQVD